MQYTVTLQLKNKSGITFDQTTMKVDAEKTLANVLEASKKHLLNIGKYKFSNLLDKLILEYNLQNTPYSLIGCSMYHLYECGWRLNPILGPKFNCVDEDSNSISIKISDIT